MNNPHEARWNEWLAKKAKPWFQAKRGRYAALSRHLGVSRQTVSRWFHGRSYGCTPVPGWAAVALNVWVNLQWKAEQPLRPVVTAQADSRFQNLEFETQRQLQFVAGSADKVIEHTTPVVIPQADEERKIIQMGRAA